MNSLVRVAGIQAQGRHGANPGERDAIQLFVVDLEVTLDVAGDSLAETVDYRGLADMARRTVEETSFQLLETLAGAVAREIFGYEHVTQVVATVHKPAAAQSLGVDDVSAEAVVN